MKEWPELANVQNPAVDLLKEPKGSSQIITLANQDNEWSDYKKRREESDQIEKERFKLEKTQVLAMRLTHEIENVVLKIALPKINSPEIIERFTLIEDLEKQSSDYPKTSKEKNYKLRNLCLEVLNQVVSEIPSHPRLKVCTLLLHR